MLSLLISCPKSSATEVPENLKPTLAFEAPTDDNVICLDRDMALACTDNTEELEAARKLIKQSGGLSIQEKIIWGVGGALVGALTYKALSK